MTSAFVLRVAALSGLVAGVLEGIAHTIARQYPAVHAPYKSSLDVLWVAPAVNVVAFLLAGLVVAAAGSLPPVARLDDERRRALVAGLFAAAAAMVPLLTLKLLHPVSVLFLAAGVGVAVARRARGARDDATPHAPAAPRGLRTAAIVVATIAVAGLGARIATGVIERRSASALGKAPSGAPNVLVLLLDTVRRDRIGRSPSLTPSLDRWMQPATWYPNAWSTTSWSLPSQASILTGRYPFEHGGDFPGIAIHDSTPSIAAAFARQGWVTGAFSGNASWVTPEHLGRGFVRFETFTIEHLVTRTVAFRAVQPLLIRLGRQESAIGKEAPQVRRELLQFLDDYPNRPFFAYLCFMDVNRRFHERRLAHPAWEEEPSTASVVQAYDSALTWLDGELEALRVELDRRGVLANTIVVVTSDHGESFGRGSEGDHDPHGHGSSLFPEQSRVPLWVLRPGATTGRSEPGVASLRMIAATLASATGLPGRERFGAGLPGDTPERDSAGVLATLRYDDAVIDAVMTGQWFFQRYPADSARMSELYDLVADPLATRAVADPLVQGRMQSLLARHLSGGARRTAGPTTVSGGVRPAR